MANKLEGLHVGNGGIYLNRLPPAPHYDMWAIAAKSNAKKHRLKMLVVEHFSFEAAVFQPLMALGRNKTKAGDL